MMEPIIGRVSDGRFRDGVPVLLVDPATGTCLHHVLTRPCERGIGGYFAIPAETLGRLGSPMRLCAVLSEDQDSPQASIIDIVVPPPGERLDIRLVLPPPPAKALAMIGELDGEDCTRCLHDAGFAPWETDERGELMSQVLQRRLRPPLLAQRVVDPDTLPPDSTWHRFRTGPIEVAWASAGPHALPAEKQVVPTEDEAWAKGRIRAGAAPTHVQQVALIAARALDAFCGTHGFADPCPGGTLKIRLCRIDFTNAAGQPRRAFGQTKASWDHVRVHVENSTEQNRGTVPHEIFHRIQYAYNADDDPDAELQGAIREGGATLAEEALEPDANRYVLRARDAFAAPWIPIALRRRDGESQHYAAAIFWRYLEERRPGITAAKPRVGPGPDLAVMRMILQGTATRGPTAPKEGPRGYGFAALRKRLIKTVRFEQFRTLHDPDRTLACTDTLYGNWLLVNALNRRAADITDLRFRYAEWDLATAHATTAAGERLPPTRLTDLPRPLMAGDGVLLAPRCTVIMPEGGPLHPWSARYLRFEADGLVRFDFACAGAGDPPIVQVARLDGTGRLAIRRGQGPAYSTALVAAPADELALVVGTRTCSARFRLEARLLPAAPVPFVTGWNAAPGDGHESDPDLLPAGWDWRSPDIEIAGRPARIGRTPRRLRVRVTNQGNAPAGGGTVALDVAVVPDLDAPFAFTPARQPSGAPCIAHVPPLAPGAWAWTECDWLPEAEAPAGHWLVRATATLDGAPIDATALGRLAAWQD